MLDERPKKMMNMYILDILKRNTDSKHPMTQKEMQKRLKTEYEITEPKELVKMCKLDLENLTAIWSEMNNILLNGYKIVVFCTNC
ncbi:MAG: hypothetical protein SPI76_08015 [Candidatus Fimenecus sp.]|nr:hypothetical protein [Candidatus Fimenecus sp.]